MKDSTFTIARKEVGMAVSCLRREAGVCFRAVEENGNLTIDIGPGNASMIDGKHGHAVHTRFLFNSIGDFLPSE